MCSNSTPPAGLGVISSRAFKEGLLALENEVKAGGEDLVLTALEERLDLMRTCVRDD